MTKPNDLRDAVAQKIAVKARKPGISRTDCKSPMSQPVNPAASLAKLLSRACQLAKLSQLRKVIVIRNATGEPKKRSRDVTREGRTLIQGSQPAPADPQANGRRGGRRQDRC